MKGWSVYRYYFIISIVCVVFGCFVMLDAARIWCLRFCAFFQLYVLSQNLWVWVRGECRLELVGVILMGVVNEGVFFVGLIVDY